MNSSSSSSSSVNKSGSRLQNLPIDLIESIISRLPAETVLDCKLVCRNWLNLIQSHRFPEKHLHYQLLQFHHFYNHRYYPSTNRNQPVTTTKIGFITGMIENEVRDDEYTLFYKEYNDRVITTKRVNHSRLIMAGDDLISSCNGLICIAHNIFGVEVLYICNPITRECVYLPAYKLPELVTIQVYGFGYDAVSKKYKAVRIVYHRTAKDEECVGLVQVYTLGSGGGWIDRGSVAQRLVYYGVLLDGALHWLDKVGQIWAFNLTDEKFCLLTKLPFDCDWDNVHRHQNLIVLGGWLSVVDVYLASGDIWSYKKIEEETEIWSWTHEFSIDCDIDSFPLYGFTNMGELICFGSDGGISLYGEDSERICELEETPPIIFKILHVNSFISLVALGEKDVKVIESAQEEKENTKQISEEELNAS